MSIHNHSVPVGGMSRSTVTWCIGLALMALLAVSAALLLTEYRPQVLGALVWLPLLLCPLMHMFMHGHGGKGHGTR